MQKSKWLLACCMLLGSCGGGDTGNGGGSTPTPAPTPTATATPTPTPTATPLSTGEIKPTSDATFLAATMEMTTTAEASNNLTGQTKSGSTMDRSTVLDTPGFAGSYASMTGYRLADSANAVTFGPGQFVSDTTATDKYYPTVLFRSSAPPVNDYLALYKILITSSSSAGSGTVKPVYAGHAGWQHTVSSGGTSRTRLDYFAYGPATPASAMPRSGVVKFSLVGSGNYAGPTDLYYTTHLDVVTVDFGAGTISGAISGGGTNFFTNGFGGVFNVTFTGSISGNSMSGPTESGVAVATGQFRLLFVGPNAEELIVTYVGQDGRGDYVGSSVGVRNPYI